MVAVLCFSSYVGFGLFRRPFSFVFLLPALLPSTTREVECFCVTVSIPPLLGAWASFWRRVFVLLGCFPVAFAGDLEWFLCVLCFRHSLVTMVAMRYFYFSYVLLVHFGIGTFVNNDRFGMVFVAVVTPPILVLGSPLFLVLGFLFGRRVLCCPLYFGCLGRFSGVFTGYLELLKCGAFSSPYVWVRSISTPLCFFLARWLLFLLPLPDTALFLVLCCGIYPSSSWCLDLFLAPCCPL